ncbi:hypothetical protein HUU51_05355 [Candidatus Gracilibacteria bacterium]|nr:hypothetical protein [Candidatus Gracilibacteria bacterium]
MENLANFIGAGLAIGLSGVGVAIGQGMLGKNAVEAMGKNKELSSFLLTITILGIALVESAAIYGLVVAFKILGIEDISMAASVGAGLAIGLAGMGAGIGEGKLIAGAMTAISNNPKIKGRLMAYMVLFVALVEAAAIYGLVIAFKILGDSDFTNEAFVGMGLAVGLAGLGVAIGQGILANRSMEVMSKQESMIGFFLTITILGIALVESAAIYGLVVAFDIFGKELSLMAATGSGFSIGLAGLGAGIGEGILIAGALTAISRNPKIKGKLLTFMVLFVALVEVTAIYGLIISFKISSDFNASIDQLVYVGTGLAIGLAGLGVAIGQGNLAEKGLEVMGKNPSIIGFMLTVSILGVALVESAVIYALVVAFKILGASSTLSGLASVGAGLAIGFAGLGAGVGEGLLIKGAVKGINADPESKGKTLAFMVLFVALVEVVAIYGLLIAFKIIG